MSLEPHANTAEPPSAAGATEFLPDEHMDSRVFIELQTDAAMRLVVGRPSSFDKPAIVGLLAFASLLRQIWDAAKNGDPYARWWLLKVEASIAQAEAIIQPELASVHQSLRNCEPLAVDTSRGAKQRRVDLLFACPYAYLGARLVTQFDALITALETSVQIGLRLRTEVTRIQRHSARAMRRVFASPQGYWNFGMTNALAESQDAKAADARAKMGTVPRAVLSGAKWPSLLDRDAAMPAQGSSSGTA